MEFQATIWQLPLPGYEPLITRMTEKLTLTHEAIVSPGWETTFEYGYVGSDIFVIGVYHEVILLLTQPISDHEL